MIIDKTKIISVAPQSRKTTNCWFAKSTSQNCVCPIYVSLIIFSVSIQSICFYCAQIQVKNCTIYIVYSIYFLFEGTWARWSSHKSEDISAMDEKKQNCVNMNIIILHFLFALCQLHYSAVSPVLLTFWTIIHSHNLCQIYWKTFSIKIVETIELTTDVFQFIFNK